MKLFKLIFLIALSTTVLIGCERRFVSPIDPTNPSQTTIQFAQTALSDLANTATKLALVNLAVAASGVAEILAIEDGTSVEPTFSRIAKLAQEVTVLEQAFSTAECEIVELLIFARASVNAVKAYTIRDTAEMEQALQDLAQGAMAAETALRQLPTENDFIPFAFGYGPTIDMEGYGDWHYGWNRRAYRLGEFLVQYDQTIRPFSETRAAMIEFLAHKGFKATTEGVLDLIEVVYLGVNVDPTLFFHELITIPGVALVQVDTLYYVTMVPPPPPSNVQIIDRVRTRYNAAWCQGSFDAIDSILIEESGLDFFDYAFVLSLTDIFAELYAEVIGAEEIPEISERIRWNQISLRSIAIKFLEIYFQNSEKTHIEAVELFRQFVRNGNMGLDHATVPLYYHWVWNK